ncbi:MAG: MEDS domain-containing protein [Acidimicrobiales bacterium]
MTEQAVDERASLRPNDHAVLFYDRDEELVGAVRRYVIDAVASGKTAVVVATEAHRRAVEAGLASAGIDSLQARQAGTYVPVDADAMLARILRGGRPASDLFRAVTGAEIRAARRGGRPVCVYGEMVALLWDEGRVNEAVELERLWNGLAGELAFSLFCGYRLDREDAGSKTEAIRTVCEAHSSVVGRDPLSASAQFPVPMRDAEERRDFDCVIAALSGARQFVAELVERWSCHDLGDDAAQVVTELASNAVIHARSAFSVIASLGPAGLRIAVHDASPIAPRERSAKTTETTGRGMQLVAALASEWGAQQVADGKIVWALLRNVAAD